MKIGIAFLLWIPLSAHADATTELRTTLAQLTATTPVHGTFEVTSTSNNSDEAQASTGKASALFNADDAGLHITYPKAMLTQANQEARAEAVDPERQTPVRSAMGRIRALNVASLLDAASMLATGLIGAQLIDTTSANYRGRPARLMTLKLNPKMSKGTSKHVKSIDAKMSVWLGDDGVPVGAESTVTVKASFMLMSFISDQKESWTLGRVGDRLIATRHDSTQKSDGMGQHGSTQVTEVLLVQER